MKVTIRTIGPPTPTGGWENLTTLDLDEWGWSHWDHVAPGEPVNINPPGAEPVWGVVEHVQRHDDRVVLTVLARSLQLPPGWEDDWRAVIAPEIAAEWVETALEEGWWTP